MGFLADRFNLEKQFIFYASHHDNKQNQIIHFMCIWPILVTFLVCCASTDSTFAELNSVLPADFSLPLQQYITLNASFIVYVIYAVWYICLDGKAGSLAAFLVTCAYLFSNYAVQHCTAIPAWKIALPIHIACWILQFIGHGVFERRAPALLSSLDQALITAPLFVLLEVLFPMGYKPDLYKKCMKQVHKNVKEFQKSRQKML